MTPPSEKPYLIKPAPDFANVPYGPHERNVLDVWLAKTDKPAPLALHIHGGGFSGGSKKLLPASLLDECLRSGISVAATNYRLSGDAPFPAAMHDAARAVQFLRHNAAKWNIDPMRLAATGGSAGGGISLWLGFHKDLTQPTAADPIARQSTALTCMAVVNAQCSYDLRLIEQLVLMPPDQLEMLLKFYNITVAEAYSPRSAALYQEASALPHLTAAAPPVFMWYSYPNVPVRADMSEKVRIHHPAFGNLLQREMQRLGRECVVRYGDDYPVPPGQIPHAAGQEPEGFVDEFKRPLVDKDIAAFFRRHFGIA